MATGNVGHRRQNYENMPVMGAPMPRTPPPVPPRTDVAATNIKILKECLDKLNVVKESKGHKKLMLTTDKTTIDQITTTDTKRKIFGKPGTSDETKHAYNTILNTAKNILKNSKNETETFRANEVILALSNNENSYVKNILRRDPELGKELKNLVANQQLNTLRQAIHKQQFNGAKQLVDALSKDKDLLKTMKEDVQIKQDFYLLKYAITLFDSISPDELLSYYQERNQLERRVDTPPSGRKIVFKNNKFIMLEPTSPSSGRKKKGDIVDEREINNKILTCIGYLRRDSNNVKGQHPDFKDKLAKLSNAIQLESNRLG